jgi:PAS domain S-box-containing protein
VDQSHVNTLGEDATLAAIVRSSPLAVIAATVDGVVTFWNAGAEQMYGYPAAEMVGRDIAITFSAEGTDTEHQRHREVVAGHAEAGYRCTRVRRDGVSVDVVMSVSPLRDASGTVVGIASVSRPVRAEERDSALLAALLDAAPDAVIGVREDGRLVAANARVTDLFGYERDALIGGTLERLVPDAVVAQHVTHRGDWFAHPLTRPMGLGLDLMGRRRDGTTFPVAVSLAPAVVDGVPLVVAAIRDVTHGRDAAERLRISEERLRLLAENVESVFTLQTLDPRDVIYVSPQFERLTGYPAEWLTGDPDLFTTVLVHPDDRALVEREFLELVRTGRSGEVDHRIVRADGEVRWMRSAMAPVPDPGTSTVRIVTTSEDVTDRILAAEALALAEAESRAANEAKNEFLSRMSHELRTPLNAILGFGQLLEVELDGTTSEPSVQHVLRAGRHLLMLIDEVLDFSRIEAGEMSISIEAVAVPVVLEEVRGLMAPVADAAGVQLALDPGDADAWVAADKQRLGQVLLNLVSNAIKYHRPGGSVRIGWEPVAGSWRIRVTDDGPGIPAGLQDRLFTPFDRLGAEGSGIEGTGVGLAITKGLVELMHGSVSVESETDHGSVFSVDLPSAMPGAPVVPAARLAAAAEPGSAEHTVVCIEDNAASALVLESMVGLRPAWRFVQAAQGTIGLDLVRAHLPDLVILDLHLPDVSGADVLAALLADPRTASVPVVVLSADASPVQARRLLAAGALRYLTKPVDLHDVLDLLDELAADAAQPG